MRDNETFPLFCSCCCSTIKPTQTLRTTTAIHHCTWPVCMDTKMWVTVKQSLLITSFPFISLPVSDCVLRPFSVWRLWSTATSRFAAWTYRTIKETRPCTWPPGGAMRESSRCCWRTEQTSTSPTRAKSRRCSVRSTPRSATWTLKEKKTLTFFQN